MKSPVVIHMVNLVMYISILLISMSNGKVRGDPGTTHKVYVDSLEQYRSNSVDVMEIETGWKWRAE